MLARYGVEGAYRVRGEMALFGPTKTDLKEYKLPTGERMPKSAANRHVLGEEALRAIAQWKRKSHPAAKKALAALDLILDYDVTAKGVKIKPARESGYFCCSQCTPAFLHTVGAVKTKDWEKTVEGGIGHFRSARTGDGKWRRFPFYYTLYTLADLDVPAATRELKYTQPAAEKLLPRYEKKKDRTSRFRKYALEAALSA